MIPPKTIQEILDAVRIEEVVEEFVALRKRGVNLVGLCPFHNERTPSFNVNPSRNIYKCFGCGKGGDAISFLRDLENFSYVESLQWLAKKYNIRIEEVERTPEQMAQQHAQESLYIVNDFALQHFQQQLFDTGEGRSVALHYFRQRGLREDIIRRFGLGYAPEQRDLLVRSAVASGHSLDLLKKTGLCSQDGQRDFFRARVMFAIHNMSGKVAAFAGRTLSSEKSVPKYINSPETEIYVKNRTLYGLFQAKKAIRQKDECILVEGYMDVISLVQAGIENVVASSGTSLTEGQLQLIKRNTNNLKILYDGDAAGIRAALRGLELALEQDLDVRIVLLPDGEDPDSYVNRIGKEAFSEYIAREAKDFILFKIKLLLQDAQEDPLKKAGLVKEIVTTLAKLPDPIKRSVYLRECATLLDVSEPVLVAETNKLIGAHIKKKEDKASRQPGADSDSPQIETGEPEPPVQDEKQAAKSDATFQERKIVELLIEHGHKLLESENCTVAYYILSDLEESFSNFDNPLYGRIAQECHRLLASGQELQPDFFTTHEMEAIRKFAVDVLVENDLYSPNWFPLQHQKPKEVNFGNDTLHALAYFKFHKLNKLCEQVLPEKIKQASLAGDQESLDKQLKIYMKVKEALNRLSQSRNMVILPYQ